MNLSMTRRLLIAAAAGTALTFAFAAPSFAETTLSVSSDGNAETTKAFDALTKAYTAVNPDVKFELESRPGGAEGDNLVKTRLSTGEMTDIFQYNSGSLFQALNPTQNLADLSDIQGGVVDSFKPVVTSTDGMVRGVPFGAAMGGGIYYNKKIYAELGLAVPKTWAEFMANNEKIKAAGKVAVAQTYKDTWSSQLFVLADFYNVQAANPAFAADYTANKAKYATTPAAMKGFEYLEQVNKAGYLNADFGAATFDDGVRMVANGEAAHYPMLTFALGNIKQNFPDKVNDVGFFAQPGDDAAKNGLTVWMPAGLYVSSKSANADAAKKFLRFVASPEGCKIMQDTNGATGPYLIKDCGLPADVPPSVADMLPYFQAGLTAPALEFVSPIKGPNLEQLTVEVGSGIRPAAEAAALYDKDVEKQAKQLGLPNW
jgi:raffinose/stachyose/melibiose transport system substrate-binding protein